MRHRDSRSFFTRTGVALVGLGVLLVSLTTGVSPSGALQSTNGNARGDVDCDGTVDAIDALRVLRFAVGIEIDAAACPASGPTSTGEVNAAAGDIDGDGATTAVDALFLLQCIVGIENGWCDGLGPARSATNTPELAFGGQFYGAPFSGRVIANAEIRRYQNGIRFRADATGSIDGVRYQNRHLTKSTVEGRCDRAVPSPWCRCVDADLAENDATARACGWTLSNSYAAGNGGLQTIAIHPDDGTADHFPDLGVELATSASYVPTDYDTNRFIEIDLTSPAHLTQGEYYHIVWTNTDMPDSVDFKNVDPGTAADWGTQFGVIGLNGWAYEPAEKNSNPVYRHTAVYGRNEMAQSFSVDEGNLPFYEVRYTNGNWLGDNYGRVGGAQLFGGATRIRQVFTVQDRERSVDGVWTILDQRSGDGPVQLDLKDANGDVLSAATIPGASLSRAGSLGAWIYTDLPDVLTLEQGETYLIEWSAPAGTSISTNLGFPLDYSPFLAVNNKNAWGEQAKMLDEAHAEYSEDAGATWQTYWPYPGKDFNVLFTVDGEIRSVEPPAGG